MASPAGIGTRWRLTKASEIGILARDPETLNQYIIVGFANSYEATQYIHDHDPALNRTPIVYLGARIIDGIPLVDVSTL